MLYHWRFQSSLLLRDGNSLGDKLVRATELVKLLSLEKSVKGAIKLVTALKLPNLAERFNTILEVSPQYLEITSRILQVFLIPCVSSF